MILGNYKYYKFISAAVGWWLGGLLVAIGAYFLTRELIERKHNRSYVYELCLLKLCSLLIKADGQVEDSEIQAVRLFFKKIFGDKKANQLFKELKSRSDIPDDPRAIVGLMRDLLEPQKYYVIIEFLFSLAAVDGKIAIEEEELIFTVGYAFGFTKEKLIELRRLFNTKTNTAAGKSEKLSRSYEILGLSPEATLEDIKKAYRRLSMEYHPDRLVDVSEGLKKLAESKFIEIKDAYDIIINSKK